MRSIREVVEGRAARAGLDLRAYRTGPIPEDLLRALSLVVLEARCAICARPLRGEGAVKARVGTGRRVWCGRCAAHRAVGRAVLRPAVSRK